jgi:peptide/nickel transport system permease protein
LPCGALVLANVGDFYLLSRQSVITVLKEPYIQTAQAKGIGKFRIIFIHTLLNAFSPIVSRIFMQMGMMLGGAVLVENVFSYPGIGKLMREAVGLRDYFMIQGIFFYVGVCVLIFNIFADIIYQKSNRREAL